MPSKVELLAHRGIWRKPTEKNTRAAIAAAFERGFGIETDVRDVNGRLMIAHDAGDQTAYPVEDVVSDLRRLKVRPTIALNIKADGLQGLVAEAFRDSGAQLFLFDMSTPDHWRSLKAGLPCLTRLSDIEPEPVLVDQSVGVWIDAMNTDWLTQEKLGECARRFTGKKLVLVSPELHGRPHREFWRMVRDQSKTGVEVSLCCDLIDEAEEFFA